MHFVKTFPERRHEVKQVITKVYDYRMNEGEWPDSSVTQTFDIPESWEYLAVGYSPSDEPCLRLYGKYHSLLEYHFGDDISKGYWCFTMEGDHVGVMNDLDDLRE